MRKSIAFILSVLLMGVALGAQNPPQKAAGAAAQAKAPEATPSAAAILDKYVQALGGRDAYLKLTSRVSKGTTEAIDEGAIGSTEIFEKAPSKFLWVGQYEGYGTVRLAFDGSAGWTEDPQSGISDSPPSRVAATRRNADFYRQIKLKELYPNLAVAGKELVNGREGYVIEADAGDGVREKWIFDVQTGLLLKVSVERPIAQGSVKTETIFDDYREVDGIKLPFTERRTDSQRTVVTRLSEVKHNVEIDDATFRKPTKP